MIRLVTIGLLLPSALVLAMAPTASLSRAIRADSDDRESLIDPTFGWSISWDPETWACEGPLYLYGEDETGASVDVTGVACSGNVNPALGQIVILGLSTYAADAAACRDDLAPRVDQGYTEVREADLDLPAAPADAERGLYLAVFGQTEILGYIECRPLDEDAAVLAISWQPLDPAGYEAALPHVADLLAGISLSGEHPAGDEAGDNDAAEMEMESYADPIYGWSIPWNPEIWEGQEPFETTGEDDQPGNGIDIWGQDVSLGGVMIASIAAPTSANDLQACVDFFRPLTREELQGDGAYVDNLRQPDLELPDAPSDAVRGLYEWDAGLDENQIGYYECRVLVPGEAVLAITWVLPVGGDYSAALPAFDELMAGVEAPADQATADASDEADEQAGETPADVDSLAADLTEVAGSGVSGAAVLSDEPDGLAVTIEMDAGAFEEGQKPYVHEGTYADYDPDPFFSLRPIDDAGSSETRNIAVAFADLIEAPRVIVMTRSRVDQTVVACGELAA